MTMNQVHIRTIEDAGRTTAVWSSDILEPQSNVMDVAKALLPAALILFAATALLIALL